MDVIVERENCFVEHFTELNENSSEYLDFWQLWQLTYKFYSLSIAKAFQI